MRFLLPLVLAALPVFERICDLACAAPVAVETRAMPRCHPEPAADSSTDPRNEDHPCSHSHDVDALLSIGAPSKSGARPSLAPAIVLAQGSVAILFPRRAATDRVRPSESPPRFEGSRLVMRL